LNDRESDQIGFSPWSVKGVDPEAREAAKIAARRAGLTVGQWLSQTIRHAATEQLRNGGRGTAAVDGSSAMANIPPAESLSGAHPQPPAPTMQAIFESIQKLSARVEAAESKTAAAVAPLAEQVDALARQIEEVKDRSGISTAPVERAVMRLTERIQKIEQGTVTHKRNARWSLFGFPR
jgi:localization factor PodJL